MTYAVDAYAFVAFRKKAATVP